MLHAKITIRMGAAHNDITIREPKGTTNIDMSKLDRHGRNSVRRRLVEAFRIDQERAVAA